MDYEPFYVMNRRKSIELPFASDRFGRVAWTSRRKMEEWRR